MQDKPERRFRSDLAAWQASYHRFARCGHHSFRDLTTRSLSAGARVDLID